MAEPPLSITLDEAQHIITIHGPLDVYHYRQAEEALHKASSTGNARAIDASAITHLDTAGALLLQQASLQHLPIEKIQPGHKALFTLVSETSIGKPPPQKLPSPFKMTLIKLGNASIHSWQAAGEFITFLGLTCIALARIIRHPSRLRLTSIIHHMEVIGIDAIPIIGLIALVISVVIAYQGQAQLRLLGVEQYTINLMAISVLREMGALLTAIMIAGRSGSAFTAHIGVMEVGEEIDALRTLGFDPLEVLVIPRLIALLLVLPLLTFIADMTGLFGGWVISFTLLDMSQLQYLEQIHHSATWQDFFVGMVKAPVFAFVIALVGCRHGLKVSGSAESVGKETTASVVEAIFLVLMLDGLFSIYFNKVGL